MIDFNHPIKIVMIICNQSQNNKLKIKMSQQTNIFTMFKRDPNCYYPCIRIDFTQIKDHATSTTTGENVFKKIVPSYNNDGRYFTDSFVLQSQSARKSDNNQNSLEDKNVSEAKERFFNRIQKITSNMNIEQFVPAEPQSFFCQICRSPFENYIDHSQSKNHIRNLQFSKGYKYIKQICKQSKRHFDRDDAEEKHPEIKGVKKIKPIRSKKINSQTSVKPVKNKQKEVGLSRESLQTGKKCNEPSETDGSKRQKNDNFGSIINSIVKQSAVEKIEIQTFK